MGDPVLVNRVVWGQPEIDQMQAVLDNDWFGPGQKVAEFAQRLSYFIDVPWRPPPYCQPVNSGSSALTLAVDIMINEGYWQRGDFIIHPLLTFPTSITPALRAGLIPIFVDIDPHTLQIDLDQLEILLNTRQTLPGIDRGRIAGAIIPHILGNICDMWKLMDLLDGRPFIEDCCDTLGGRISDQHVGTFGHIGTFSFYGSHHITTAGVGGALVTTDKGIFETAKSLTHWGRNNYDNLSPDLYEQFDKRYWYDTWGHDFQMTEIQAAFGIAQLDRVTAANKLRTKRFFEIDSFLTGHLLDKYLYLPQRSCVQADPSWFSYPLIVKPNAPFSRKALAIHLMERKIEIRPIFTGNILTHPAFVGLDTRGMAIVAGGTDMATLAGENGLFLPAWGMSNGEIQYLLTVLENFFLREKLI